jgi:hypothetical protein
MTLKEYRIFNGRCKVAHVLGLLCMDMQDYGEGGLIFSAGSCLDLSVFVLAYALFCERTPVEACRAEYTGVHLSTGFALCFGLITPDLNMRIAEAAFYIFRFGLLYVFAAGTFALEHNYLTYLYYYI